MPDAATTQGTFDDLGTPLATTTFVVVDLETTGGSAKADAITEIGAVKVRGGEVLGEFQTLVRPAGAIPPFIAVLTGITDAMVAGAPPIAQALPAFLEFARGSVLVAHNAPFDIGFLRHNAEHCELPWPPFAVLDTARIAARALTRDEAPNCKLATLARIFGARTQPCHRALADAQATVDVLHALIARVGNLGVHSVEELRGFSDRVPQVVRRKRHLADGLPAAPGVYVFRDGAARALYVGKSRNVRARVRQYFTSSETRRRMAEMVRIAERVDVVPCSTDIEAEIRELRLLDELRPPYNRRSKRQHDLTWLTLTREPFPRLSLVRSANRDDATYLGPFGSRISAELARTALHEAVPIRQCGGRLPRAPSGSACALAEMGRCGAPCEGRESASAYSAHVEAIRLAARDDPSGVVDVLEARLRRLADAHRYEDAALHRNRIAALLHGAGRVQRLVALTRIDELVAARRRGGGWDISLIRRGRLAASAHAGAGQDPWPHVHALIATAETIDPSPGPVPAASAEETECLLRWLEGDGVRLILASEPWASPARGARGWQRWVDAARQA